MADKRPAPPLPLENKLLKTLSACSVAGPGAGRRTSHGPPAGLQLHAPHGLRAPAQLENRLLARLSLRSAALTRRAGSALPLRSSVLAKYEADHRPEPPPPPPPEPIMVLSSYCEAPLAAPMCAQAFQEEACDNISMECYDVSDDDMALGLFDACESADPRAMAAPRKMKKKALARMAPLMSRRLGEGSARLRGFGGASGSVSWALPEPQYDFKNVQLGDEFDDRPTWTSPEPAARPELELLRAAKLEFLTAVCVSLVSQPNFKQREDPLRQRLLSQARQLARREPEFILKVTLYSRHELMLRTTSNFLLSLAALVEPCRPYLRKYFAAAVRLPTDWIEVAEIYQTFDDSKINFGSLPAALRKVMAEKFADFDNYQLAKYNKAGKSKKKKKANRGKKSRPCADDGEGSDQDGSDREEDGAGQPSAPAPGVVPDPDAESDDQLRRRSFTIKKLVRLLHVSRPVEPVMSIIGKKYPADPAAFRQSGLPGTFDSSRAGQRMRLPVPETWETQVAQRGNKAEVWQQLIDNKKLPYMAMLRNLRNLILAKIGAAHHDKVISTLTNETAVLNSKQMVFRFLSAYAALDELETMITEALAEQAAADRGEKPTEKPVEKPARFSKEFWMARKKRVLTARKQKSKYDLQVVRRYREALDRAVAIATVHNVPPIAGHSLIFCDVSERMNYVCASAKGMGKPKTARTMALLLSLMCQRSSEFCELTLFGRGAPRQLPRQRHVDLLKQAADEEAAVEQRADTAMDCADADADSSSSWESEDSEAECSPAPGPAQKGRPAGGSDRPKTFCPPGYTKEQLAEGITAVEAALDDCLHRRQWIDNLVVMGSGANSWNLSRTLQLYRETVNPNLQFVNVDLIHTQSDSHLNCYLKEDPLNVNLFGFSDQILRFVAERGTTGQLAAVDAIDAKYSLRRDIRLPAINLREAILASEAGCGVARWRTVRVFISSTFLDFHGERDLLIRHALPELRGRARALRLDLQVVDLRWGITAQDAESARQVELCLLEVDRCQLFVGLLGARCGQTADTSRLKDPRLLEFIAAQQGDLSLTALEMLYATREPARASDTAIFYERDEAFLRNVPGELMSQFADLAPGRRRVAALRSQLQSRGCLIKRYTAQFGQLGAGRHGATDLQTFGESVLEQLWHVMQTQYPLEGGSGCDLGTEEYTLQHEWAVSRQLIGRKARLARAIEEVERGQGRFVLVSGKPGSGKTSFMARAYTQLVDTSDSLSRLVIPAFCGAGQRCATSAGLVSYIRALLARQPLSGDPRHRQAAEVAELLAVRGRRQHVVLVLDGLDAVWAAEAEAAADWLPERVPQNVTILISADEGGPLYRRLNSQSLVSSVTLGSLDLSERSGLVREMLQEHSKSLEEKAWNNQLRTLTSKRGAGDALYLQLACEELRTFGVFEQLSVKLASLGQTVSALIQDIIARLEASFAVAMVKQVLCAVTISAQGLAEDDLFEFLKQDFPTLTQFAFTSLVRSGECLLQRCAAPGQPALLRLAHAEMARSVRARYLAGPQGAAAARDMARALAEYFERRAGLQEEKFHWQVPPSVLQALPYFWALADDMAQYRRVVCSLRFLMLKAQSGQAGELLSDVRAAHVPDSPGLRLYLQHPHVTEVADFVSHNLHLFSRSPSLVLQQALNEPADSWLRGCGEQLLRDCRPPGSAVVRLSCQPRRSVAEPRPCLMTLKPAEAVTAAVADPDRDQLYVGLPSGEVKQYDLSSGRETRTYTGHGEPITCLALLSGGSHLVSGAADGQLSVWETSSGRRLAITRAHRRRVAALAVQPDGLEFVSAGWSCDIKLWRFRSVSGVSTSAAGELEEMRVLQRGQRPLSCAAFHPERPLVATAGWDGAVKIWDTVEMKRKAVRHGHDASVRCLAISPDASYLVSGDMQGWMIVWGTKHGDWIQKSRVHDGPIQAVCYLGPEKFVTAGADGDIKLWRSHVGSEVHRVAAAAPVQLALAAPHGSLLTVTTSGEVSLQPAAPITPVAEGTGRRAAPPPPRWSRRQENVTRAACDEQRVYLAVGRSVLVLRMADGRTERQLAAGAPVTSLACLPPAAADSAMGVVLIGLEDGRVGVALADRGELVTTVAHAGEVTDIAVSVHDPERPRMATGGRDGMVLLWSGEDSWGRPYRSLAAYSVPVSALAWLDDQLVTAGQDSQMHVYARPGDAEPERRLLTGNDAPVTALCAHSGGGGVGSHLMSVTAGGQTLLWTSRLVAVTEQQCRPGARPDLTRLPDGRLVALLPGEADTAVVDLQKMSCLASFGDHTAAVSAVAAAKHSLVSASLDGSVKLWRPEQSGRAAADSAALALRLLHVTSDGARCLLSTVSRAGHVTVWRHDWAGDEMPQAVYQVNVLADETDAEKQSVLLAAIGSVSVSEDSDAGTVTFSAGCLTGAALLRADITVPLSAASPSTATTTAATTATTTTSGGGSHTLHRCADPVDAPALCLTAGVGRSLMIGDSVGRVTVFDAEMNRHAHYRCGAGSDPAIAHIICTAAGSVVTCGRNGMICTLKQTDRLNILHAAWRPALPSCAGVQPPPAKSVQLAGSAPRPPSPMAPLESDAAAAAASPAGPPTAVLVDEGDERKVVALGDARGQLWWSAADGKYTSHTAHSSAVTWLGRDPSRADILYTCGRDRRLVVWRLREQSDSTAPVPEQVGEFEFAGSVRVCAALSAWSGGAATRLLCADDRGRLHCLLVDLEQVAPAPAPTAGAGCDLDM